MTHFTGPDTATTATSRTDTSSGRGSSTRSALSPSRGLRTAALVAALVVSALALGDGVTFALAGQNLISDSDPADVVMLGSGLAHGVAYLVLGLLLVAERRAIDAGSRVRATFRWALTGSFALLVPFFLVGVTQALITDTPMRDLPMVYEVTAGLGFAGMFLSALALGLALWRSEELRPASRFLSVGLLVGLGCTIALGILAPDWSHPAYLETAVYVGTALLGYRSPRDSRS